MKLEQSFEVAAPLERVWEALIDVERVAPCLPGAAVTGRNDDGSYNGTFKVKIGPTSASYTGKLKMEQVDESVHTATMDAQGTDKRGQGGAKATIVSSLADAGNGATRVDVVDRLPHHRPAGPVRARRDDRGHLQPAAGRLRQVPADQPGRRDGRGGSGRAETAAVAADTDAADAEPVTDEVQAGAVAAAEAAERGGEDCRRGEAAAAEAAARAKATAAEAAAADAAAGTPTEAGAAAAGRGRAATAASAARTQPMPESEPVQGLSLMASALWGQAKRNPAQAIALVVGFLLALRVLRRRSRSPPRAGLGSRHACARPRCDSQISATRRPCAVLSGRSARVVGSSKQAAGSMAMIPLGLIIGCVPVVVAADLVEADRVGSTPGHW